jgi:hypothetical protein
VLLFVLLLCFVYFDSGGYQKHVAPLLKNITVNDLIQFVPEAFRQPLSSNKSYFTVYLSAFFAIIRRKKPTNLHQWGSFLFQLPLLEVIPVNGRNKIRSTSVICLLALISGTNMWAFVFAQQGHFYTFWTGQIWVLSLIFSVYFWVSTSLSVFYILFRLVFFCLFCSIFLKEKRLKKDKNLNFSGAGVFKGTRFINLFFILEVFSEIWHDYLLLVFIPLQG